jgi:hypothetical protein
VLARLRGINRDLRVQVVWAGNGNCVDEAAGEHILVVGKGVLDAKTLMKVPHVVGIGRGSGHQLDARYLAQALGVGVRDKTRSDDSYSDAHRSPFLLRRGACRDAIRKRWARAIVYTESEFSRC